MKINRLDVWPHVHICPLDPGCWLDFWRYGTPLRVHRRGGHFWEIPGLVQLSTWRSRRIWDFDHPIQLDNGAVAFLETRRRPPG